MKRITITLVMALSVSCSDSDHKGRSQPVNPSPLWVQGKSVFELNCKACHSISEDGEGMAGPSLYRFRSNMDGTEARQSIIEPKRDIVPGYPDIMPDDFGATLTEEQMDALIFYLTNG